MRAAIPLVLALALALGGCKAKPAADSGFLKHSARMTKDPEQYPFHRVWFAKGWNAPQYKSLVVKPVNTKYIDEPEGWAKVNSKKIRYEEDVAELARFTRETFQKAFREDKKKRFEVVDKGRGDSLVLELALVEVVPNEALLGALGLAATASVVAAPVGTSVAAKESGKGRVAIEARFRRARDGVVVAMFADREHGKFGPINVRRATWYGEAHKIIEEWAAQCVKAANADRGEQIGDTKTFTLRPW
jgi:hypothetical protein